MSDNFMNKGGQTSDESLHENAAKKHQLRRRTSIAVPNDGKNDIHDMEKLKKDYEADAPKDDYSVQDKGKDKKDKLSKKESKAKEKAAKADAKKAGGGDKPRKLSKIGTKKPKPETAPQAGSKPKGKPQAKPTENKQTTPTNKGGNLKPKPPGPASPKPKVKSPPPKPKPKPKSTPKKPPAKK